GRLLEGLLPLLEALLEVLLRLALRERLAAREDEVLHRVAPLEARRRERAGDLQVLDHELRQLLRRLVERGRELRRVEARDFAPGILGLEAQALEAEDGHHLQLL